MKKGFVVGLFVGFLLAGSLVSVLYLSHIALGTPFVPFDLFDGLTRVLPGQFLTFGIDSMVRLLMFLGLSLRGSAKTAEQIQALAIFITICAVAAGLFFAMKQRRPAATVWPGFVLGIVTAVPMVIAQRLAASTHEHPALAGIWTMFALTVWGGCVSAVRRRFAALPASRTAAPAQTVAGPRPTSVESVSRRRFLVNLGGATASVTVLGTALAEALRTTTSEPVVQPAPEATRPERVGAVIPAPGTRSEYTPVGEHYRIDIDLMPMKIDEATWKLPIVGMVDHPLNLPLSDLRHLGEPLHQVVTLSCISNPLGGDLIGTTRWSGVSVHNVLRAAGVRDQARFLKITSADGFYETVPLELIASDQRIMFTYAWDGRPLTSAHGFPLRIYIPDRYGMKQPKWIVKAELVENDEPGYWVARGWDKVARMKSTSVIDTVAVESAIHENDHTLIPIGGIAHAGARGISRVEVRVDDGEWTPAALRPPLSDLTWVLWRYDWPFQTGNHLFSVRCYDRAGAAQIATVSPPHPSGASGIFSTRKRL